MNLVFFISEKVILDKLAPFIWVGGTPTEVEGDLILDVHDFFHAPLPAESIRFLDADLLRTSWQWFLAFSGQIMRWDIRSKHSIEALTDRYVREVAGQIHFLKKYDIRSIHCHSDPHRGRDYLLCKLAGELNIPVYTYITVNVGLRTFVQTELGQRLDNALLLPEKLRDRDPAALSLDVIIPNRATSKSADHSAVRPKNVRASNTNQFRLLFAVTNFFGRLRTWLRRQYVTPKSASLGIRFFSVLLFRANASLRRLQHNLWWRRVSKAVSVESGDVVFYAHYWPERSTNPGADPFFTSQLTCVQIMMATGRQVYFQEHPDSVDLKNRHRNRTAQGPAYRRQLRGVGVPVIKPTTRREHIVATMAGTVGLESALEGLKVVCFGKPWYGFLSNVHVFKTFDELQDFLEADPTWTQSSVEQELRAHLWKHSLDARTVPTLRTSSEAGLERLASFVPREQKEAL